MIYKMKLTDSVDSMVFDLLEVPIVDKDIEGAVDNVTLDGNQYTDYLYLKKQYVQKWTILCDEEYTKLRGFYTRQWENSGVPSYRLYYGEYTESTFAQSGEYMNFTTEGLESKLQSFAMDGQAEQDGTPTPDAPVSIETVTGENTVKVVGKNLFDMDSASLNTVLTWATGADNVENKSLVSDYIPTSEGNSYKTNFLCFIFCYDGSKNYLGTIQSNGSSISKAGGGQFNTFTIPSGYSVAYMRVEYRTGDNGGVDMTVQDIMLELGSAATAYEPYQGQEFSINLGSIELAKIGTYQDYIWNDNGTWKVHKAVGKASISIDGYTTTYTNIDYATFAKPSDMLNYGTYTQVDAICESAISPEVSGGYDTTAQLGRLCTGASRYVFWIGVEKGTTQATAETLLNGKALYYPLAEPVDEEITNSTLIAQLDAIESASLPVGTVNIYTEITAGNAMPTLNITGKNILSVETDIIPEKSVRLTLTDDGVINTCGCRRNVQLTMRETIE